MSIARTAALFAFAAAIVCAQAAAAQTRSGAGTAARAPDLAVSYLLDAIKQQQAGHTAAAIHDYEQAVRLRPDFLPARYNLSQLYLQTNRTPDAIRELRAVAEAPAASDPHLRSAADFRLGQIYAHLGQDAAAQRSFEASFRLDSHNADALAELGILAARRHDDAAAIRYLKQYTLLQPANALAMFNLGVLYGRANQLPEALHAFQASVKLRSLARERRLEGLVNIGRIEDRLGRTTDAIASFSEAIRLEPSYGPALEGRALDEQRTGKLDAALHDYDALLRHNADSTLALFNSGVILAGKARYELAAARFSRVVQLDPRNLQARGDLAYAQASESNTPGLAPERRRQLLTSARDLYLQLEAKDPKDPNHFAGLAFVYEQLNDLKGAAEQYEQMAALAPGKPEVLERLASVYARNRNWPKAIEHEQEIVRLRRDDARAWMALSGYQSSAGKTKDASETLKAYLTRHPGDTDAGLRLATLLQAGPAADPAGAEQAYRAVIARQPNNAQALQSLADLVKARDPKEAARLLESALSNESGSQWLMTGRELADLYTQQHQTAQVIDVFNSMVQSVDHVQNPQDLALMKSYLPFIRGLLAETYLGQKDYAGALRVYEDAHVASPQDPAPVLGEARVYEAEDRSELALERYAQSLQLAPGNLTGLLGLLHLGAKVHDADWLRQESVRMLGSSLTRPDAASVLGGFRAAAIGSQGLPWTQGILEALAAAHPDAEIAQVQLANLYNSEAEWQKALDLYTSLIKNHPDSARYYEERGRIEEQRQQNEAALSDFKEAARIAPTVENERSVLRLLERSPGSDSSKVEVLTRILDLEPASVAEAQKLSNLYSGATAIADRIALFRKLIAKAPNIAVYHDSLAAAIEASGDHGGARSEYQAALALNPYDTAAKTALSRLGEKPAPGP